MAQKQRKHRSPSKAVRTQTPEVNRLLPRFCHDRRQARVQPHHPKSTTKLAGSTHRREPKTKGGGIMAQLKEITLRLSMKQ